MASSRVEQLAGRPGAPAAAAAAGGGRRQRGSGSAECRIAILMLLRDCHAARRQRRASSWALGVARPGWGGLQGPPACSQCCATHPRQQQLACGTVGCAAAAALKLQAQPVPAGCPGPAAASDQTPSYSFRCLGHPLVRAACASGSASPALAAQMRDSAWFYSFMPCIHPHMRTRCGPAGPLPLPRPSLVAGGLVSQGALALLARPVGPLCGRGSGASLPGPLTPPRGRSPCGSGPAQAQPPPSHPRLPRRPRSLQQSGPQPPPHQRPAAASTSACCSKARLSLHPLQVRPTLAVHLQSRAWGRPRAPWARPPRHCPPTAGARWSRRPAPARTRVPSSQARSRGRDSAVQCSASRPSSSMPCCARHAVRRPQGERPHLHNGLLALALRGLRGLGLRVVAAGVCRVRCGRQVGRTG